jgi:hypothetical protein
VDVDSVSKRMLVDDDNEKEKHLLLRFGYLGKWSPCVCESLNTKGETITLVPLLYVLISH